MKLVEAQDHLLYIDPKRFIEKNILPLNVRCAICNAKLTLDFESDLFTFHKEGDYGKPSWTLGFTCMVCHNHVFIEKKHVRDRYRTVVNEGEGDQLEVLDNKYYEVCEYYKKYHSRFYIMAYENDAAFATLLALSAAIFIIFLIPALATFHIFPILMMLFGALSFVHLLAEAKKDPAKPSRTPLRRLREREVSRTIRRSLNG